MSTLPTLEDVMRSSNIAALGHDGSSLYVRFKSGGLFKYGGVPHARYEALKAAPSVGQYFHREIKGHYPGEKVE